MNWFQKYQRDIGRYQRYSKRPAIVHILTQQGLWALFVYRLSSEIYTGRLPIFLKKFLLQVSVFFQKIIEVITGICLPYSATIGAGLYIGHYGTIILHPDATLGENCNLSQGVTVGISGRGEKRGVPQIGDQVYIGVNAVVVGKIVVGNGVVIGANSLVNRNIQPHCTVLGVPAVVVNQNDAADYISPGEK